MNSSVNELVPSSLWKNFVAINQIPRPSKKEEAIIAFIKSFGESLNLPTTVDEAGNIIITKPATKGMQDRTTVVLQSHIDMVHQKNSGTNFDFEKEGIKMFVDGDWVKADGTTLGADNGIGVASIMALLESSEIPHPPLEALFTIDEETGMTGALALKGGLLHGEILLNLDTEDDTELTIGCAGGVDVTASGTYQEEEHAGSFFTIQLNGLTGGHSGMDIHKGRANANKLMNRVLYKINAIDSLRIATINGGSLRNAIPRESVAIVAVNASDVEQLKNIITDYDGIFKNEYSSTDPKLALTITAKNESSKVISRLDSNQIVNALYACPNAVYRLSPDIAGLVQTSNNIAKVTVENKEWTIQCLTRSSVDSEKVDLSNSIAAAFSLIGGTVRFGSDYPGWMPKPDAAIVTIMENLYEELFQEKAHVNAVHAGLECGIIGKNYPKVQMISFGPNILGAHSPDERVQISSVQKFWKYLLATLEKIPTKN